MKINIREILKGLGLYKDVEAEEQMDLEGVELSGPLQLKLRLTNAGSRVLVKGKARANMVIECARCAEDYTEKVEVEVDDSFVPDDSPEADAEGLEALEVLTFKDDHVVLDELIRQELLAAMPIKPVCRADCPGLCDQCGASLSKGSCGCSTEELDPRWAPLQKLQRSNGTKESIS